MRLKDLTDIIYQVVKSPTDVGAIEEEVRLAVENPHININAEKIAARRRFVAVVRHHREVLGVVEDDQMTISKKHLSRQLEDDRVRFFAQLIDDSLKVELSTVEAADSSQDKASFRFFLDQMREEFRRRLEEQLVSSDTSAPREAVRPILPEKPIGSVCKAKPPQVEEAEERLREKGYKF